MKAIVLLPVNVTVILPVLILWITNFKYNPPHLLQTVLGVLLLLVGLFLAIWTMVLFQKIGKGTLAPWAMPKHLVTQGPFKIIRNPMIAGILLILSAQALILNTIYIFYWAVLFFIINCIYFKLFEEKQLERNFGKEYLEYKKNVPMFFPKFFRK